MVWNKLSDDYRVVFKNFSYLSLLRVFNIGIKFLLVAYLIRALGDTQYGVITWLDSVIQYFIVIVNFGFNIYATKILVDARNDSQKTNEIFSSVLLIKALLFIVILTITVIISFGSDFQEYRNLFILFSFVCFGEVLFPIWYFQSIENLRPATAIVFISRLSLFVGVLLFVKSSNDLLPYVSVIVASSALMGLLGFLYVLKKGKLKLVMVNRWIISNHFKKAFPFFMAYFLSLVFNFGTIYLIGKFCNYDDVAGFDVALKVVLVGMIPFDMVQQAVFPTISRNNDKSMLRKFTISALAGGIIMSLMIFTFSEELMLILGGPDIIAYQDALKVLCIILPFTAITFVLGTVGLVAFGFNKDFNNSLIFSSIIYFLILGALYFAGQINFWNLVYLRVLGDIILCIIRVYFSIKRRLFHSM